jgi:hypothetical protein
VTLEIARRTVARLNQAQVNDPVPDLFDWFLTRPIVARGRRPPGSPRGLLSAIVSFDDGSPTAAASSIDYVGSLKACWRSHHQERTSFHPKESRLPVNAGAQVAVLFREGRHIVGFANLTGLADKDAIATAHLLFSERRDYDDAFEIWDGARFVISHPGSLR